MAMKVSPRNWIVEYSDLHNADYHSGPGLSSSDLKDILESPKKWAISKTTESSKRTAALAVGAALHEIVLTPNEPYSFCVSHLKTRASKAYAEMVESCGDRDIILEHELKLVHEMARRLRADDFFSAMLDVGVPERSVFSEDKFAILAKARLDLLAKGIIADVKTIESAQPIAIQRAIDKYHYDLSASWYVDLYEHVAGVEIDRFVWFFLEKKPPYLLAKVQLSDEMFRLGRQKYQVALDRFWYCYKTGDWFDVWPEWLSIDPSPWIRDYWHFKESQNMSSLLEKI